jgi:arsenite-transporting ATPase
MRMKFLDQAPRFLFFTGKGGVGKTSLACATSIQLAADGKRVLLVSTDPASNVGQVFGIAIGNLVTAVTEVPGLSALEIDPQAAAKAYRDRIVGPVRGVLPDAIVKSIEEQLSGACTTEIAAFDEFTALLTDGALTQDFDHVVFDTAPTGHTIRMLQLPGAWSGFLETGKGDASCLGPLAGLEKQRTQYKAAVDALADGFKTRMVLVARAQAATLNEAARTHGELAGIGLTQQYLVINGVFPESETAQDPLAQAIFEREQAVLTALPVVLRDLPTEQITLKAFNLVGLDALRQLLAGTMPKSDRHREEHGDVAIQDFMDGRCPEPVEGLAMTTSDLTSNLAAHSLSSLVDNMALEGHGLVMLMGKGGVGKTTLAAAVAVELATRGFDVHLSTSDPAAHLTDTLQGTLAHLTVSRIDPHEVTEAYRAQVLANKGATLDAAGRAVLEEDLRSPCTEEIAVFQAFSRIIREAGKKFVVMDTAPTGHTLLLLDATGAYHRDMARQMAGSTMHFRTPMMQLQDSRQTKVLIVTLAETTPVLEAANLQADLQRAGITPWAWVINNSVAAAGLAVPLSSPLLRQRAANEWREIDRVTRQHAPRIALVPLLADEPIGVARLLQLAASKAAPTYALP